MIQDLQANLRLDQLPLGLLSLPDQFTEEPCPLQVLPQPLPILDLLPQTFSLLQFTKASVSTLWGITLHKEMCCDDLNS